MNSGNDDPWNRVGLNRWDENTRAFQTIRKLAKLRKESRAVSEGSYITVYANNDTLVFERRFAGEVVLVAVNRGEDEVIGSPGSIGIAPGTYSGVLGNASEVNEGNYLSVAPGGWTMHLNKLSALVVHRPR